MKEKKLYWELLILAIFAIIGSRLALYILPVRELALMWLLAAIIVPPLFFILKYIERQVFKKIKKVKEDRQSQK